MGSLSDLRLSRAKEPRGQPAQGRFFRLGPCGCNCISLACHKFRLVPPSAPHHTTSRSVSFKSFRMTLTRSSESSVCTAVRGLTAGFASRFPRRQMRQRIQLLHPLRQRLCFRFHRCRRKYRTLLRFASSVFTTTTTLTCRFAFQPWQPALRISWLHFRNHRHRLKLCIEQKARFHHARRRFCYRRAQSPQPGAAAIGSNFAADCSAFCNAANGFFGDSNFGNKFSVRIRYGPSCASRIPIKLLPVASNLEKFIVLLDQTDQASLLSSSSAAFTAA